MVESTSESTDDADEDLRWRLLLLVALLSMTPLTLSSDAARSVASVEATVVAVTAGLIAGAAIGLFGERLALDRFGDAPVLVGALAAVAVGTVAVWLFLPDAHYATLSHFTVAILWAGALAFVARRVVWPKLARSTGE